jgi:hypothetical protein
MEFPLISQVATLKDTKQNPVAEWWFSYPCVTRWWFALCCITTLISWDKLPINLPPTGLMLYWPAIIKAQVWRLLTTFTYFGSVGHNMLMEAVFMLNYSKVRLVNRVPNSTTYLQTLKTAVD